MTPAHPNEILAAGAISGRSVSVAKPRALQKFELNFLSVSIDWSYWRLFFGFLSRMGNYALIAAIRVSMPNIVIMRFRL